MTLLLCLLDGVPAMAQAPFATVAPFEVSSSFHSLLKDPEPDLVEVLTDKRSPGCTAILRKHLQAGHRFDSRVIEQFILPLSKFPNPRTAAGAFFHYTNVSEMFGVAADSTFENPFIHMRTQEAISSTTYHDLYFYVATDAKSSASYGGIRVGVKIDPSTPVLMTAGDSPRRPGNPVMAKKMIEDELVRRYPDLQSCRKHDIPAWDNGILVLLAAEARGVGLIAYYGIDNAMGVVFGGPRGAQWFQVLGPWAIQKMDAVRVRRSSAK